MVRKQVILKEDLHGYKPMMVIQESTCTYLESKASHILEVSSDCIKLLDAEANEIKQYLYDDIECVNVSMCSRYAGGSGRFGGIRTTINIDFDLVLTNDTVYFEIVQPISFRKMIDVIIGHNIEVVDMVGVIDIYDKYPDYEQRAKYLETHFNELSKKYKLDHPRFKSRFKN